MDIEIKDNDKKQITPRICKYVEVLLLIGLSRPANVSASSTELHDAKT